MTLLKKYILVILIWVGGYSVPAYAGDPQATIFVIDFVAADRGNKIAQYVDMITKYSKGESRFAVIDPRGGGLLVNALEAEDSGARRGAALRRYLNNISIRLKMESYGRFNLPWTSQLISETLTAFQNIQDWDVIFLGSIAHQGEDFVFADGYPNDGFVFLKDSEFGYVSRLPSSDGPEVSVHVFYTPTLEHEREYDRFMDLWVKQLWAAKLISFNDGVDFGTRLRNEIAPLDARVSTTRMISPNVRPLCETFDATSIRELAYATIEISISNPCRSNSQVVLRNAGVEYSGFADNTGTAKIVVNLNVGMNEVEVRTPEGEGFNIIHSHRIGEIRDAIETIVSDGKVTIQGYHPMREEGTLVTIVNEQMNREWTISVTSDQTWVLEDVPLGPGVNQFYVTQIGGVERMPVVVRNAAECQHSRQVSQVRGLAQINFQDSCLAGQSLTLQYRGDDYTIEFNASGKAVLKISLTEIVNRITYDLRGASRLIEIPVSEFSSITKFTLSWDAQIDLDMHILEPDGNRVYHLPKQGNFGFLDLDNFGTTPGRKQENYTVEVLPGSNQQVFEFTIVNYSRRSTSESLSDHCEGGMFQEVPYVLTVLDRGHVTTHEGVFEPFPCDASRAEISAASTQVIYRYEGN